MSANFGRGLHAAPGRAVSASAYDRYLGRWSRLSVPDLLGAAEVAQGHRVLDVATGTGEAAAMSIPIVGDTGFVVGADISLAMVTSARIRLDAPLFWPVNADGQSLPLETAHSMPSCASLVYSSSLIRPRAFQSSGASSEPAGSWQGASTPHPTGCRCGAIFAMHWIGFFRKNNVLFWSCHGRLPIGIDWMACSGPRASETFVSSRSDVKAALMALRTTGRRSRRSRTNSSGVSGTW